MPRFFFHIRDQYGSITDHEGCELEGIINALDEAKASARELAKQYIDRRQSFAEACIHVVDEEGIAVAALHVREVVTHPEYPKFSAYRLRAANLARIEGALDEAEREHLTRKLGFETERRSLDGREAEEDRRWLVEEAELIAAVQFSQRTD
jgi:hypothetical protein